MNIRFGVELETKVPRTSGIAVGGYHSGYPVRSARATNGLELAAPTFNGATWRADRDGSITCEPGEMACEFVSPTDAESALRAPKLLAEVEERELRLAVKKREYVALTEVQECWTAQVARAKDLLRHKFELELPPILSGLDAIAIQAECGKALDEVFTLLHEHGGGVA
jgi:hypothetical protein